MNTINTIESNIINILKNKKLLIDSNILTFIKSHMNTINYEYVVYDHLHVLNKYNILSVINALKVQYFSISQLVKYNLCNPQIEGSIANHVKQFIQQYPDHCIINNYFRTDNQISIISKTVKHLNQTINDKIDENIIVEHVLDKPVEKYYITSEQIEFHLSQQYYNFYKSILGAKILYSSFFLSELINFDPLISQVNISKDIFFQKFSNFQLFAQDLDLNYTLKIFKQYNCYEKALEDVIKHFDLQWKPFKPNFILSINNFYLRQANIYKLNKNLNVDQYYLKTIKIKTKTIKKRTVKLNIQNYGDKKFFYMNKILGLSAKSLQSVILENIYDFIFNNKVNHFLLNNNNLLKYLAELKNKITIVNKIVFLDHYPTFFYFSTYNLEKIKMFLRKKKIFKTYIINCKTLEKTLISIRDHKKRNLLHFAY